MAAPDDQGLLRVDGEQLPQRHAPCTGGTVSQLWLIEGLPGSGKTSAAARLSALCNAEGLSARWWLEEASDHPVLPSSLRKLSASPEFADHCIKAFQTFIAVEHGVLILEGSAFQNTVRFMFAHERPIAEISGYVAAWAEAVTPARPRLLMFKVEDPRAHYTGFVAAHRGEGWMERLVAYVESTPVAQARRWSGIDGFVRFWTAYQELCLGCAVTLPWPVSIVTAWSEANAFDEQAALDFFRG